MTITLCIEEAGQLQTKTFKLAVFMTTVFGQHKCYEAGKCENGRGVNCVEAGT